MAASVPRAGGLPLPPSTDTGAAQRGPGLPPSAVLGPQNFTLSHSSWVTASSARQMGPVLVCPLGWCHQRGKDGEYLRGLFCSSMSHHCVPSTASMAQPPSPCHQPHSLPACALGWWVPQRTHPTANHHCCAGTAEVASGWVEARSVCPPPATVTSCRCHTSCSDTAGSGTHRWPCAPGHCAPPRCRVTPCLPPPADGQEGQWGVCERQTPQLLCFSLVSDKNEGWGGQRRESPT